MTRHDYARYDYVNRPYSFNVFAQVLCALRSPSQDGTGRWRSLKETSKMCQQCMPKNIYISLARALRVSLLRLSMRTSTIILNLSFCFCILVE
jgi:hypothetical protein